MILIHIRTRVIVVLLFVYLYIFVCNGVKNNYNTKKNKFEAVLQDVYNCKEANPAYASNHSILSIYAINVVNGRRYLSGNTTVIKPTPFRNFSARSFFVNNGKRELKMQLAHASCRNIFARSIIMFSNISFSQKDCMLKQGKYQYTNMDLDKILHSLPSWHALGTVVHQLQLVSDGATELCEEIVIDIRSI